MIPPDLPNNRRFGPGERAGAPARRPQPHPAGMSRVTTAPAPTNSPVPTVRPCKTTAPLPTLTSSASRTLPDTFAPWIGSLPIAEYLVGPDRGVVLHLALGAGGHAARHARHRSPVTRARMPRVRRDDRQGRQVAAAAPVDQQLCEPPAHRRIRDPTHFLPRARPASVRRIGSPRARPAGKRVVQVGGDGIPRGQRDVQAFATDPACAPRT